METSSAMDYERINKVQTGLLSPSKLKLKLLGSNYSRRKGGRNSSATTTSPSKSMDMTFAKTDTTNAGEGNLKESEGSSACLSLQKTAKERILVDKDTKKSSTHWEECSKKRTGSDNLKSLNNSKVTSQHALPSNLSTVHPVRTAEAGSSFEHLNKQNEDDCMNFEFHKGGRSGSLTCPVIGAFSRPLPSKWNDAEKWIFSPQEMSLNPLRSSPPRSLSNHDSAGCCSRTASEFSVKEKVDSLSHESIAEKIDSCSFGPERALQISEALNRQCRSDLASHESNDTAPWKNRESSHSEHSIAGQPFLDETALYRRNFQFVKTVSMRDMGTEMTPMTSQEQSRIGTPIGPETPHRSCETSRMSTPGRAPMPSPAKSAADDRAIAFSEEESQSKTRKEIVDLGLKLGKMSIAAWARRDKMSNSTRCHKPVDVDQLNKVELVSRAAAWQEAENSKHLASFRRKEIKIQVRESNQKAKIEAELRKIEARVEKMRAHTQLKMRNKISRSKQQAKAKLASAEAWKIRQETKTAKRAESIRRTGRIRMPSCFVCCSRYKHRFCYVDNMS